MIRGARRGRRQHRAQRRSVDDLDGAAQPPRREIDAGRALEDTPEAEELARRDQRLAARVELGGGARELALAHEEAQPLDAEFGLRIGDERVRGGEPARARLQGSTRAAAKARATSWSRIPRGPRSTSPRRASPASASSGGAAVKRASVASGSSASISERSARNAETSGARSKSGSPVPGSEPRLGAGEELLEPPGRARRGGDHPLAHVDRAPRARELAQLVLGHRPQRHRLPVGLVGSASVRLIMIQRLLRAYRASCAGPPPRAPARRGGDHR